MRSLHWDRVGDGHGHPTARVSLKPMKCCSKVARVHVEISKRLRPKSHPSPAGGLLYEVKELGLVLTYDKLGSGLLWARSTGLKIWPGATALVDYITQPEEFTVVGRLTGTDVQLKDKTVLELGCGLGVVSLVAGQLGAKVIATDGDPDVVTVLKDNLAANTQGTEHTVAVQTLPWGSAYHLALLGLDQGRPNVVVLTDVVYGSNPGVWEKLVMTLHEVCSRDTLVLQAETYRLEGRYDEYWGMLEVAGFVREEVVRTTECDGAATGGAVRIWRVKRTTANI